ncbi:MAG: NAD(P)-dependent oxidoreductase [Verrucomicrobiae bacterium]|nr:NAD(P)-dependent oxidoreductase [Verrucomicrobiae bacterium]
MNSSLSLPNRLDTEDQLDELLSRPNPRLVEFMKTLEGDILIAGVAGKMGLSLARLAVRATSEAGRKRQVVGVARFSEPGSREQLEQHGVKTIPCDLLNPESVAKLPQIPNVIFMAGRKFGTEGNRDLTWATNTLLPGFTANHFRKSRIVAFSTGCVYPFASPDSGGCTEKTEPQPVGEYAQSCLGRERVFEYYSRQHKTPVCLYRLNYAIDLRYGVLHDIATKVWRGEPVDVTMPCFNIIWQGDANHHALLALQLCEAPPSILNVTGPEILLTRETAAQFGKLMNKTVQYTGHESQTAYLNNSSRARALFGAPMVTPPDMIRWVAQWMMANGRSLGKPAHFEVKTGKF